MYTYTGYNIYMAHSPCFLSSLADSLLPSLLVPFTYLETLLAVTGSVHLGLRLLINWPPLSQPFPTPSPLQIPSAQVTKRLTKMTSRIRLLLSGTALLYTSTEHLKIVYTSPQSIYWETNVLDVVYNIQYTFSTFLSNTKLSSKIAYSAEVST